MALAAILVAVMVFIAVKYKDTGITGAAVIELKASLKLELNAMNYYAGSIVDGRITLFFDEAPSDTTISVFVFENEKKKFSLRNIFIDLGVGYVLKDDGMILNNTIIIPLSYFNIKAPDKNGIYSLNVEVSDKNLKSRMSFGVV
ncbi:MAG: hypothetical protein Q7J54_06655 [Candidatus Woesearchaeota archaeon]|nr:hypothetical protein [Candidatus Woesearchaeota archaeon]